MKLDVLSLKKTAVAKKDLPLQFEEPVRPDINFAAQNPFKPSKVPMS